VAIVYAVINGYLNDVEPEKVRDYEAGLFEYLRARYGALLGRIEQGFWENEDVEKMKEALKEYKR
jgi:F-type H+-transporting ATPase subunit alpha